MEAVCGAARAAAPRGRAYRPLRCTSAARGASGDVPAARPVLNALVVVEGTHDVEALRRAVDCAVAVTNGTPPKAGRHDYMMPPGVLRDLAEAARGRDVIVFADPDSAGRAMRIAVAAVAQPLARVRHAFIGHHLCRCAGGARAGATGVEFASAAAVRAALSAAREQEPSRAEFTRDDLEAWGLAGRLGEPPPAAYEATGGVAERRNAVAAALGIGPCDGKTFLKYANEFGFTRQEVTDAVAALDASAEPTPPR